MNKEGQFFLVAAIIISGALFALGTIYISSSSPKPDKSVEFLSDQIFTESSSIIDSGVFNGLSPVEIDQRRLDLLANYSKLYPQSDLFMVYGNNQGIYYEYIRNKDVTSLGSNSYPTSGKIPYTNLCVSINQNGCIYISSINNVTTVKLPNNDHIYNFNSTAGEPFYLIVKQEDLNERIVSTK